MRIPLVAALAALALLVSAACGGDAPSDGVAVRVRGIALDPAANAPVVILEELDGPRQLPIWIGVSEARSILAALEHQAPIRPNTHDLAKRLVDGLEADVQRVLVRALEDGIYYADLVLRVGGRELRIDARPSDAIALAVRADAPVFVYAPLFDAESLEGDGEDEGEDDGKGEGRRIRLPVPDAPGRQLPVRSL
ncbi:MAG: bifunctional nuclease family protein [Myxococcota bacterium]|nr:bifunctional nuclease family protein [Myxococcota bacterium]